jgi:hypothetical protein
MTLGEQELFTLLEHRSSSLVFSEVRVAQSFFFCVVFCISLFALISFFFYPFWGRRGRDRMVVGFTTT